MPEASLQETTDQTLQEISGTFHNNLLRTDNRLTKLYDHYVKKINIAYWMTVIMFLLASIILLIVVAASCYFAFQVNSSRFMQLFSVMGFLIGTIAMAFLLLNNPLRSVKRHLLEVMKIGIIYSGYTRQIYQIDAEFRKKLLNKDSQNEVRNLVKQTQIAVEQVVQNLSITLDDPFD